MPFQQLIIIWVKLKLKGKNRFDKINKYFNEGDLVFVFLLWRKQDLAGFYLFNMRLSTSVLASQQVRGEW